MKLNTQLRILLAVSCLSIFYSCKKKEDVPVEKIYSCDGQFWYKGEVGDSLEASGSHSLSFYVDNQLVGIAPIYHGAGADWWYNFDTGGSSPSICGADSTFTYTKSWKWNNYINYNYRVKDQTGKGLWAGTLNFSANACASVELAF